MDLGNGLGHLTYSTLVHPSDDWTAMWASLTNYVPKVKARVSPNQRFGVSLRISNASATTLVNSKAERDKLKKFLADNDMYIYTVNAFVFGAFKNTQVKEQVYEPDWSGEERTQYTINVARILADVVPPEISPSIQSAPLGFKPKSNSKAVVDKYTENVVRVAAELVKLEQQTGRTDPTGAGAGAVLLPRDDRRDDRLLHRIISTAARRPRGWRSCQACRSPKRSSRSGNSSASFTTSAISRSFTRTSRLSCQKLVDAGVPIFKFQEAAAMRVPQVTQKIVDVLKNRFSKTIYLTQTFEKKDGKINRYLNLEDAFAAWEKDPGPREWRTHFHVPVFLDDLGDFGTTRFAIEDALKFHKKMPISRQLEIETYTWDVLPDHLKTGDIVDYVSREIEWVRGADVLAVEGAMKVGFIGLGRMGNVMVRRLLEAGHEVAVYNRSPDKAKPLADAGAKVVTSVAEAARFGDAVYTMLSDDAAVEDVATREAGIVKSLPKGGTHICAGTHGVGGIRRLKAAHEAAGQTLIAAPVLGRPEMVSGGQAGIVVGGKPEALKRFDPLFAALGARVIVAGDTPEAATAIKLANNFVLGCAIEAIGEGMSLVRKYGVVPEVFLDVMTGGLFNCGAYKVYGRIIVDESYDKVGQIATNGLKDANLVLAAGELVGVPLPSGNVWRDRLVGAVAHGDSDKDWAVMALEQARASGLA